MAATAILKNRKITISLPRSERFRQNLVRLRRSTLLTVLTVKIFSIFKIQDGSGRHFEKSKNRDTSAAVWTISTKFGMVMQFDTLDRYER